MRLGDASRSGETISTGALTLDLALGGGYPKGRVVEIYGPESSGKTTLTLHAIAEVQRRGGVAAFVDAEHALDPNMRPPSALILKICWSPSQTLAKWPWRSLTSWCARLRLTSWGRFRGGADPKG